MSKEKLNKDEETPETPTIDTEARAGITRVETAIGDLVALIKEERVARESMQEEIKFVADKSRQAMWDEKTSAGKDSARVYKLATYNGKLVVGWSAMKQNVVFQEQNKTWIERLNTELYYEDGSQEVVDYKDWQLARVMVEAVYEGEELSKDTRIIKLVTKDGKKLSIDVRFLN